MSHPTLGRCANIASYCLKTSFACLLIAIAGFIGVADAQQGADVHAQAYSGGRNTRALITQPIEEARLVTLTGNTHPAANAENDRGAVSDNLSLEHMQLVLQRPAELEKALEAFMQEQQRKGSPEYHHWLNAKQFADRYGVSPQDIEKVSNWLQNHGFRVDHVLPSGMAIEFSGTAGQVKQAFHTEIHNLDVDGEAHFANMSDPQIPAALTGVVVGVHALHNFMPHSMMKRHSDFTMVDGSSTYYAVVPADVATIYNLNPAFANGITGAGQTVVVIEDTLLANVSDVATFRSAFGLSGYTGTFSQIAATGAAATCGPSGVNGDEGEAALDAEWAGASAPDASIVLASCADTNTVFGGLIALQNLISATTPPQVVSISYGNCEASNGAAANLSYESTYQQAAAAGVSVFVSSGDEGAASCDANRTVATHGIAVSGFTSTPYNVSVGGTDFGDSYASLQTNGLPLSTYWSASNTLTDGSALSYIPEIPWNDSCASELIYTTNALTQGNFLLSYGSNGFCNSAIGKADFRSTGSGSGGPSAYEVNNKPFWQSVLGNPNDNTRDIPDVSLFAANGVWNHFLLYCLSDSAQGGTPCDYSSSNYTNVLNDLAAGGTSFSSPIMAGMQALVNQSQGATLADPTGAQGNPNSRYYALGDIEYGATGAPACNSSLGTGESSTCVFNDVTLGDIDVNCRGTGTSAENCYGYTGTGSTAVQGALSTSTSTLSIAYGTNSGWDFATGLGSVNAYNLIQNWDSVQTTTTVTSSGSLLAFDESVTLTATITPAIGSTETGTVDWSANANCAPSTVTAGVATCTTTSLPLGTDSVTATYSGDANYAGSNGSIAENVVPAPAITSSASATFIIGTAGSFIVTTTGTPTPAISEAGALPAGVSFVDNGDGTATISGTPAAGTGATYSLTITADNGTTNAGQSFTLTVTLPQEQFTATANPAAGGTITPVSGSVYSQGTVVPILATPATGYTFVGWTSATDPVASATSASTTITMNGPESVTAQFSPNLVVNTANDDSGNATKCTAQATAGTNSVDSSCSLRDALLNAANSGAGNISFDTTVFSASNSAAQNTITLQNSELMIPNNTSINGATSGAGATLTNLVTVSGNNNPSIPFTVFAGESGSTPSSINALTITGGTSSAISNFGNLTVTSTTLSHNQGAFGGAIQNHGTMQLSNSTLTANNAPAGGCIENSGTLTVTNSTLTACVALTEAGGINNESGGVLTVQSSTIYANSAGNTGGGILNNSGPIVMSNSIVSANSAPAQPNYNGSIIGSTPNNVIGGSPNLEPLGNYGGPTQTMLPPPGSSAICAGTVNGAAGVSDQRGFAGSTVYGSTTCFDAGAVQSNYALSFSTEPPASATATVALSPAPVVELTESGAVASAANSGVYVSGLPVALTGTPSMSLSAGLATFSSLIVPTATASETLTATLALNSTINLTANSTAISVAAVVDTPATIVSPAPGSVLSASNQQFTWAPVTGATGYVLSLGTTGAGSYDLLYSGQMTGTSAILKVLPTNGETIYARLFTNFSGTWMHVDYTYTATAQAAMASPAPSSTLSGPIATFTWSPATGATGYLLSLGSTGAGSYNLYYSGQLTTTSTTVSSLPTNGETVYARLFTNYNGTWVHTDYIYAAATVAPISPLSGSTLPGPDVTFTWPAASGATGYVLALGTTGAGSYNLYYSGSQTALSVTVNGLPVNGTTIYARLSTNYNGTWVHVDSIYSASTQAAPISPLPNTTLSGANVTFAWTAAYGATGYVLELGSTGAGSYNLYYSGQLPATTATAKALPTNGETIYARLLTNYNGVWVHTDYTLTAAP